MKDKKLFNRTDGEKADGWEPNDPYLAAEEPAFLAKYQNPPVTYDMIKEGNKGAADEG
jgi:hypothetical protein